MPLEVIPDPIEDAIDAAVRACPTDRNDMPRLDRVEISSMVRAAISEYLDRLRGEVN